MNRIKYENYLGAAGYDAVARKKIKELEGKVGGSGSNDFVVNVEINYMSETVAADKTFDEVGKAFGSGRNVILRCTDVYTESEIYTSDFRLYLYNTVTGESGIMELNFNGEILTQLVLEEPVLSCEYVKWGKDGRIVKGSVYFNSSSKSVDGEFNIGGSPA